MLNESFSFIFIFIFIVISFVVNTLLSRAFFLNNIIHLNITTKWIGFKKNSTSFNRNVKISHQIYRTYIPNGTLVHIDFCLVVIRTPMWAIYKIAKLITMNNYCFVKEVFVAQSFFFNRFHWTLWVCVYVFIRIIMIDHS